MKTGELIYKQDYALPLQLSPKLNPVWFQGLKMYFSFFVCIDCGTMYRKDEVHGIQCNGASITKCPWCRPDSKPWKNGRGI